MASEAFFDFFPYWLSHHVLMHKESGIVKELVMEDCAEKLVSSCLFKLSLGFLCSLIMGGDKHVRSEVHCRQERSLSVHYVCLFMKS